MGCTKRLLYAGILAVSGLLISFSGVTRIQQDEPVFLSKGEVWAKEKLSVMTLEEKIAQFFMVATWSGKDEEHQKETEQLVREQKIGGLIYFQGTAENLKHSIQRMQHASKVPLLIGMDAEWGAAMRLSDQDRFPYAYTIGTAADTVLTEKIAFMMAQQCRELGIHINFAPVADVNSNAENPVIGFRSFGEEPGKVAAQVAAFVRGMEKCGVMTSIKHFPGHGDTDKDSHFELPVVSHDGKRFKAIDFPPFWAGIKAGASSVMVGHLNVPALDPSGTPSSLSSRVIKSYLRDSLQFKGLVISDALNMKAISGRYGASEAVVKAFEAGCDILLYPESVKEAIKAISEKVKKGKITEKEIEERCLKILKAKYHVLYPAEDVKKYTPGEIDWAKKQVYEKALTVVKNRQNILPVTDQAYHIAIVNIGGNASPFNEMCSNFSDFDQYYFKTGKEAVSGIDRLKKYDIIITSVHPSTVRSADNYGMPQNWENYLRELPDAPKKIFVLFGNPVGLKGNPEIEKQDAVILAYENHSSAQDRAAQLLFGAIPATGKMGFTVSDFFKKGIGIQVAAVDRLKFSQPEELGINSVKFSAIDSVVQKGIRKGAFPGCQVFVAVQGKVIYNKSFGTKTYGESDTVLNSDLYDIASVSKIAGSTSALMYLQSKGKFNLQHNLKYYIPEITGTGNYGNIVLRDMMAHQAGLKSWIPFYKRTLKNGHLDSLVYSDRQSAEFPVMVANDIYIRKSYADSIYKQILSTPLNPVKKYEYSDLGYYFAQKIIEKEGKMPLDEFMYKNFYTQMGLRSMRYNPLNFFPVERIAPTEDDKEFRRQVIRGTVHDPGAAMLGGVAGHAGIFSTATDLGVMMQLFLNKGTYAGKRYLDEKVVELYTKAQNTGNRRGAGFDRPTAGGSNGPCSSLASQQSYGHSGFTGTFVWADPADQLNYVFLSNRVYPNADNWKIRDMNIRSEIQRIIYETVRNK